MKKVSAKLTVLALTAALALFSICGSIAAAPASDFPSGTITVLVGYSAGSVTDLGTRLLVTPLAKVLGVPVVIENVPGSGGWISWARLIDNTEADGYTLAVVNQSFALGAYDPDTPRKYKLEDVTLLAGQVIDPNVMAIRPDETRFTDFASFVKYAQENEVLVAVQTVGFSDGDATMTEWLRQEFGCKISLVPVDAASDGRTMFIAGDVDVYFASMGDVYTHAREGVMKAVVIFNNERSGFLPEVPTIYELGFDSSISSFSARGYACPKGTDPEIAKILTDAMLEAMKDEEYQKQLVALGLESHVTTGGEFYDLLKSQLDNRLKIWKVKK